MQPATINFCALPVTLCCAISRMVLTDSCLAESMNEQVLMTMTSASSAFAVIWAPPVESMPIITSLSTRFLGQPRLTKPTFTGAGQGAAFCGVRGAVGVSTGMYYAILSSERPMFLRVTLGCENLDEYNLLARETP